MKVPFRIVRGATSRPVIALLLPGHEPGALLEVCAHLRLDPPPDIHAVADGFLVRMKQALTVLVAGVVRLSEAGANLLLPHDADLVPALLPDEASALGSKRGLIFLPGGRVLEFDPSTTLSWSHFLQPGARLRTRWHALPDPTPLAEALIEIEREDPPAADDILDAGGEGIGVEPPRPEDASLPKQVLGKSMVGLGKALQWLGLGKLGADTMKAGMSLFPRLSEKVFGAQEAGLRALLRDFLEGNIEQALRRALPLNAQMGRNSSVFQGSQLPTHDTRYSLGNILGGALGSFWISGSELFGELERQYRKQAQEATRRGDYRRAAFIYGKLLNDYRSAAAVLSQGGLHRDAALLYLKVLHDYAAAARAFEAAGDFDRALQLYRQQGEYVLAGDLLRKIGEEDLAVAEYQQAAEKLLTSTNGYFQAGEMMLRKARRPDLAQKYFETGWQQRPWGAAVACARALTDLHSEGGNMASLLTLVAEAELFFAPPGNEAAAADFFNHVAGAAQKPELAEIREELHDRTLVALAGKLGQNSLDSFRWSSLVTQLFPTTSNRNTPLWPTSVVSDAHFALRAAVEQGPQKTQREPGAGARINIDAGVQVVRAVARCPITEEIFLGFASGEIVGYDPTTDRVNYLRSEPGNVEQLVLGGTCDHVIALCRQGAKSHIESIERSSCKRAGTRDLNPLAEAATWLFPSLRSEHHFGVIWEDFSLQIWDERSLVAVIDCDTYLRFSEYNFFPLAAFLITSQPDVGAVQIAFDGQTMFLSGSEAKLLPCALPVQRPAWSVQAPRCTRLDANHYQLVALDQSGAIFWLRLTLNGASLGDHILQSHPGPFLAAILVRDGAVAAVDRNSIVHLRFTNNSVKELARLSVARPDTVACFACQATEELILISLDGTVERGRWLP